MPRATLWSAIAETLRGEIAARQFAAGAKLPTESALATRFGVNRHTVRQALGVLASEGLVQARRGSGIFVMREKTDYALGRRVRFHENIAAGGATPSRRITRMETRPATDKEAGFLKLQTGEAVHLVEGVSFADDQPLAAFRSVFPATRFPDLLHHLGTTESISAALSACGLTDYTRAETRITAKLAPATLAHALFITAGAPILRSVAVNVDSRGLPVEYGTTWFAGDRVTLTVAP